MTDLLKATESRSGNAQCVASVVCQWLLLGPLAEIRRLQSMQLQTQTLAPEPVDPAGHHPWN